MEVTIYRCSNKNYWYQKYIGMTYNVEDAYSDIKRYKVKGENLTIDLEDTLEDLSYDNYKKISKLESIKSEELYIELRNFLQSHNSPADLKQKLYVLFVNASFFD